MPDVFVSHSTKDDDIVNAICRELTTSGIDIWVDHYELVPGVDWRSSIHSALNHSQSGLLVVSKNSVDSQEVSAEWSFLLELKKALYIVKIDDVPKERINYRLHSIQRLDLAKDWNAGIEELIKSIKLQRNPVVGTRGSFGKNWIADFYSNTAFDGQPVRVESINGLNFNWPMMPTVKGAVITGIGQDNFSVRFTSTQGFETTGRYQFDIVWSDSVKFYVDGQLRFDDFADVPTVKSLELEMISGRHLLVVEYFHILGAAVLQVQWH